VALCKVTPFEVIERVVLEYRAEVAAEQAARKAEEEKDKPKPPANGRSRRGYERGDNRVARCRANLAKIRRSVQESDGSGAIWQAAKMIYWDYAVDESAGGFELLVEYNATADPPWDLDGSQGLRRVWDRVVAAGPGDRPRGWKLDEDRPDWAGGRSKAGRPAAPPGGDSPDDEVPPEEPPREDLFDSFRLARLLISLYGDEALPTVVSHNDSWWQWRGGRYELITDGDFVAKAWVTIREYSEDVYREMLAAAEDEVAEAVEVVEAAGAEAGEGGQGKADAKKKLPCVPRLNGSIVSNAIAAARSLCHLPADVTSPVLLTPRGGKVFGDCRLLPDPDNREFVAVRNGLIDVPQLIATGATELLPPTPLYFTPAALPVSFDPNADCPRFMAFLARVTDGDAERQLLLQEMFGYLLRFDTRFQVFFVLTGDGGNGKSTLLAALWALLGEHNISSVPLEVFGERFQLTATLGKLVNAVAEVGDLDKVAEATLKSFVGGDLMLFDRKNKTPLNVAPTARLLLSCNALPRFGDRSDGVWRRQVVIPFDAKITDAEKVRGMDKPEFWRRAGEVPGILNWAIVGMHRLYKHDGFTRSAISESAKAQHQLNCKPHKRFLGEHVQAAPNGTIPCTELYAAYVAWCHQGGTKGILADTTFGIEVKKEFKGLNKTRPGSGRHRPAIYEGIAWQIGRPSELLVEHDRRQREARQKGSWNGDEPAGDAS
jgi:P4 family phage/plasmid primase-like protien